MQTEFSGNNENVVVNEETGIIQPTYKSDYVKKTAKQKREEGGYHLTICHYCRMPGGTLKVERNMDGKKLKIQIEKEEIDGKMVIGPLHGRTVHYHVDCKVNNLMGKLAEESNDASTHNS